MTTKVKELSVIKILKKGEDISSYGFRNLPAIKTNVDTLNLIIQANSMAFCDPQEDVELEMYTTLQIQFKFDGSEEFVTVEEVNKHLDIKIEGIDQYLVNDIFVNNTYGNVPLEIVEKIYLDLTAKKAIKTETVEKKVVKKKVAKPKAKRKITKKQAFNKVKDIIKALNSKFYEMEEEIQSLIISLLAKEHVLMVGLPGIAKSDLARQLGEITGGNYFDFQLQQTTTPDEVFGGINHEEYIKGNVERNINNKMATAEFAHLDEIFKANSAVLNHMLQVLNERTYDNNGKIDVPLISAVGASNEFPYDEELGALYDRFLLRHYVTPMKNRESYKKMFRRESEKITIPKIELDDLYTIHEMVEKIKIEESVEDNIYDLVIKLQDEGIYISPRRTNNSLKLLRANAFIEGRDEVLKSDLIILKNVFWSDIEDKDLVTDIVEKVAIERDVLKLNRLIREAEELVTNYEELPSNDKKEGAMEGGAKLKNIGIETQHMIARNEDNEEMRDKIKSFLDYLRKEQDKMINQALVPIK